MTVITVTNDMWTALERYQPFADKRGFGAEWRRMTEERTPEATWAAYAEWSAWAEAATCAAEAVERIKAIKLEEKL